MFISINMAMSLDGKIATKKRGPMKLGTEADSRRMAEIRAEHDVVINGGTTFKAYPYPLKVEGDDLIAQRKKAGKPDQPASAMVSSQLNIERDTPWENATEVTRWAFCGTRATATRVKALEVAGVKVVRCRLLRPTPKEIIQAFKNAKYEKVLLEGGGEFNASFLEEGLVNRIYLTVVPKIIGGSESPTWCEGKGFEKFPQFKLAECRQVGDELYLTYERS